MFGQLFATFFRVLGVIPHFQPRKVSVFLENIRGNKFALFFNQLFAHSPHVPDLQEVGNFQEKPKSSPKNETKKLFGLA